MTNMTSVRPGDAQPGNSSVGGDDSAVAVDLGDGQGETSVGGDAPGRDSMAGPTIRASTTVGGDSDGNSLSAHSADATSVGGH